MTELNSFQALNQGYLSVPKLNKKLFWWTRVMHGRSLLTRSDTVFMLSKDYDHLGLLVCSDQSLSLETDEGEWYISRPGLSSQREEIEKMQSVLNEKKYVSPDGETKQCFLNPCIAGYKDIAPKNFTI